MLQPTEPNMEDFERCWPWMEASIAAAAFEHNGKLWPTHNKQHVWERLAGGKAYLWPGEESVIVTEFYTAPTGLKSHHTWVAGGELHQSLSEIVGMMPMIEDWGRQHGAHRQTGTGRRGWVKAFTGYVEIGTRKSKSLILP
jgi:hypothetical protein